MIQHASDEPRPSLDHARFLVRQFIAECAANQQLQDIALNHGRAVVHLAVGPLAAHIHSGQVKINMIQRWVMEAISSHGKRELQKHNVFTGQYLFRVLEDTFGSNTSWCDQTKDEQYTYEELARRLMEHLEICFQCGSHSDEALIEVAGDLVCWECMGWATTFARTPDGESNDG